VESASISNFDSVFQCMRRACLLVSNWGSDAGAALHQFLYLFDCWCSFVSGRTSKSMPLLKFIDEFSCSFEQCTLFKWTTELKALQYIILGFDATSKCSFTIEKYVESIRSATKKDYPSACSSALLALSLAIDGDYRESFVYSKFAITKLSQRLSVTFIGAIYLFCAAYAAAIVLESHYKYSDSPTKPFPLAHHVDSIRNCITLTMRKLKTLYQTSQPCLIWLYRTLKIKYAGVHVRVKGLIKQHSIKKLISSTKINKYDDFLIGKLFMHLECVNMLSRLSQPSRKQLKELQDEMSFTGELLVSMGSAQKNISNMWLFQHIADNPNISSVFVLKQNAGSEIEL
jgi:hypothetical protein